MIHHRTVGGLFRGLLIAAVALIGTSHVASAQTTSATIAPGDVLKIAVYGNPDLATVTRVMPNGTITFPLIGQVNVGQRTTAQAETTIAERLMRGGYVRNAAVSVFVQERSPVATTSVTLLGHVVRSGTYTLDPESPEAVSNLVTLLAKAGGTTENAANYCYLIREENGQPRKTRVDLVDLLRNGNVQANHQLRNRDIVLVPARPAPGQGPAQRMVVPPAARAAPVVEALPARQPDVHCPDAAVAFAEPAACATRRRPDVSGLGPGRALPAAWSREQGRVAA